MDSIHDEIAVPNPFAQALLFFRGGANGDEAPIRVIQGPKTLLSYPTDNVVLDGVHREVFVAQSFTNSVFVFRSDVGGDVAPIRIVRGPKTRDSGSQNGGSRRKRSSGSRSGFGN